MGRLNNNKNYELDLIRPWPEPETLSEQVIEDTFIQVFFLLFVFCY